MKRNRKSIKRKNVQIIIRPKTGQTYGKTTFIKKKSRQMGGFLNRYDFTYASRRDVVNQVGNITY